MCVCVCVCVCAASMLASSPRRCSGDVQVLRNAVGVGDLPEQSATKVYGSTLSALRGDGWVSNFQKKVLRNI